MTPTWLRCLSGQVALEHSDTVEALRQEGEAEKRALTARIKELESSLQAARSVDRSNSVRLRLARTSIDPSFAITWVGGKRRRTLSAPLSPDVVGRAGCRRSTKTTRNRAGRKAPIRQRRSVGAARRIGGQAGMVPEGGGVQTGMMTTARRQTRGSARWQVRLQGCDMCVDVLQGSAARGVAVALWAGVSRGTSCASAAQTKGDRQRDSQTDRQAGRQTDRELGEGDQPLRVCILRGVAYVAFPLAWKLAADVSLYDPSGSYFGSPLRRHDASGCAHMFTCSHARLGHDPL